MNQGDRVEPSPPGVKRPTPLPSAPAIRGLEEYALACRRVGQSVLRCGGTWWREFGIGFFRPILPFLDVPSGAVGLPRRSALGGWQYPACAEEHSPNSSLAYIAFANARDYRLENLRHGHRWEVRSAGKRFEIRGFHDEAEFAAPAYPIYLEFHERTRYRYLDDRIRKPRFVRWADAEFADPGLVALGAWAGRSLVAVSLSRVVGEAWIYSAFFASDEGLRGHAASLMLHHVRSLAAAVEGVTMVFGGTQKLGASGLSVDAFYLHRGAAIVRRPAVLRVSPIARWALPRLRPDIWNRLRGDDAESGALSLPAR